MKESKMDGFFKEKLANRKEIPSENAWNKLSAELNKDKKNKSYFSWYVAAGIALLFGVGYAFFFQSSDFGNAPVIVENDSVIENIVEEDLFPEKNEELLAEVNEEIENQLNNEISDQSKADQVIQDQHTQEEETEGLEIQTHQKEEITNSELLLAEEEPLNLPEQEEQIIHPENIVEEELLAYQPSKIETDDYPEIVITYKKTNTEEKPEKAIKKIVQLARDISEGGYGLGQLREAKNDLLAFDKKNNKNQQ